MVGRFTEDVTQAGVATPSDVTAPLGTSAGMLARHEPGEGHELACGGETAHVSSLSNDGHGGEESNAPERLERVQERCVAPSAGTVHKRNVEPGNAITRRAHLLPIVVQDDLIGNVTAAQLIEPLQVGARPGTDVEWRRDPAT